MTNLLFSIVVLLQTNTAATQEPERFAGIVLTSNPPQYPTLPATREVRTWCDWVTNLVQEFTPGVPVTPPIKMELGRARIWEVVESFEEKKVWASKGVVTNYPPKEVAGIVHLTNGMLPFMVGATNKERGPFRTTADDLLRFRTDSPSDSR